MVENTRKIYFPTTFLYLKALFTRREELYIYKYQCVLRKYEKCKSKVWKGFYKRKKNKLMLKTGIQIFPNVFQAGLKISHLGSIVVGPKVKVGKNCTLHGNNCIGNDGFNNENSPTLGDNVDIGYGAIIVGKITIASNVKIGAGAVVTKSVLEEGVFVAGVPAKIIKKLDVQHINSNY